MRQSFAEEHFPADVVADGWRQGQDSGGLYELRAVRHERTEPQLDHLATEAGERRRTAQLVRVPRAELVRPGRPQVVADAGTLDEQPLDEVEHVGAGPVQGYDARQLMPQVLNVQFRAEGADAHVERRAAAPINDVDVAACSDQQRQNINKLPVGGDVYRGLSQPITSVNIRTTLCFLHVFKLSMAQSTTNKPLCVFYFLFKLQRFYHNISIFLMLVLCK